MVDSPNKRRIKDCVSVRDYPIDIFPNWSVTNEKYYVAAPVDRLGEFAFHLRTHLTSLILAGNPAIAFLQSFNSPAVTKFAKFFSFLGLEEFYLTLIVVLTWLFDARLGRLLAVLLSLGFFISGSLKVSLCLPRPPIPPAIAIGEENKDWAWPSNHALIGTAFPWFIWIYASKHYDLSILVSFVLLVTVFTCTEKCSRICLFASFLSLAYNLTGRLLTAFVSFFQLCYHTPLRKSCLVLTTLALSIARKYRFAWVAEGTVVSVGQEYTSAFTHHVMFLEAGQSVFFFCGFSDRLYDVYVESSPDNVSFFIYLYSVAMVMIWIHPRAWPETQSFMEVVSVSSGAAAIWAGRIFHLGGAQPSISLLEQDVHAPLMQYLARLFLGFAILVVVRIIAKFTSKTLFTALYNCMGLEFYSYSAMCKSIKLQPTKRFTNRMRFRAIPGQKVHSTDDTPYDVDLPVKFLTYSAVGFMVSEGCPALFATLGI